MPTRRLVWYEDNDPCTGTGWSGWLTEDGEMPDEQPEAPDEEQPF